MTIDDRAEAALKAIMLEVAAGYLNKRPGQSGHESISRHRIKEIILKTIQEA